jgi:uncharacterized protein YggE
MLGRAVKDTTEKAQIMVKAAGCELDNVAMTTRMMK